MTWRNPQSPATKYIGIDSGVNTGLAIWNATDKKFDRISTVKIHAAMLIVLEQFNEHKIHVRVEDARLRKWFGKNSDAKLQGAGSVKRDATIWEDFLKDYNIPHQMIHPIKGATKMNKDVFARTTKYTGLTSEHSRDAAMLVFGM